MGSFKGEYAYIYLLPNIIKYYYKITFKRLIYRWNYKAWHLYVYQENKPDCRSSENNNFQHADPALFCFSLILFYCREQTCQCVLPTLGYRMLSSTGSKAGWQVKELTETQDLIRPNLPCWIVLKQQWIPNLLASAVLLWPFFEVGGRD